MKTTRAARSADHASVRSWRLAVGGLVMQRLPPATRGCHPPPENLQQQLGQHAVLPLPRCRLCRDAVPTLPGSGYIRLKNVVREDGSVILGTCFSSRPPETSSPRQVCSSRTSTVRKGRLRSGCSVSMAAVASAAMAAPGVSMTSA